MVKEHSHIVVVLAGLLDLVVTAGAWLLCFYVRFYSGWLAFIEPVPPKLTYIADVIVICLLLVMLVFSRMGLYRPRRITGFTFEFFDLLRACLVVWVVLLGISYFLRSSPISRQLMGMFPVVWLAVMTIYRGTARLVLRQIRKHGRNLRAAAIVGAGRLGQKLFHSLRRQTWTGYDIRYFVEDHRVGQTFLGVPVRGPVEQVDTIIADHPVDAVFVALPREQSHRLDEVLGRLSGNLLLDVNVVPDLLSYQFLRNRIQQIGGLHVVNLTHSAQSGWNAAIKQVFDVLVSLVLLIVLCPLMLLIAAGVKLTGRGPVFYRQRRASLGGREFDILKFRSMVVDAEARDGATWSVKDDDPRITRLGRILRRLSLDELPQFINVLKGDMSLVGPRPERPEFIARFGRQIPRYMLRHHVKAGITGWAQVNGYRGRTSLQKRIQYDLDYINRWSFSLDLWILVLTVVRGFTNNPKD
jgi:Undecaprenyl-phosphate glucose phosphotransferase